MKKILFYTLIFAIVNCAKINIYNCIVQKQIESIIQYLVY